MKVFVINLRRSTERRERMTEALNKGGISFEFIDAVSATDKDFLYSNRRNEALTRKRFGYKLLENEIACFSSHHLAWEKCIEVDEPILVLEDNCDLTDNFYNYFNKFDEISKKYNFLKLAATKPKKYKLIESIDSALSVVRYIRRTCGIMGYIITPKAAKKFIENATQFLEPVDNYMEKPYKHGITTYVLKPDLVTRAKIQSTIGSSRKNKSGIKITDKIYIELFRLYEQINDMLVKHPK